MKLLTGRWPPAATAVATLYFLLARLSDATAILHGAGSTLWAPAGLGIAVLVLFGWQLWPGIAAGALAADLVATHGHHPLVALAYACGQTLEVLAACAILARAHFNPRLRRIRDVLWLLIPGAFLPTLLGATIASLAATIGGLSRWSAFWTFWHTWWLGDATGVIVLAPLVLTLAMMVRERRARPGIHAGPRASLPRGPQALELTAFLAALCLLVVLTHALPSGVAIALPPLLIWSALRFGPPGAALATAVTAVAGAAVAHHLSHDWSWLSAGNRVLVTQEVFAVSSLATLILAAALAERQRLVDAHRALGRFATAVANELPPDELIRHVDIGSRQLTGMPAAVVEGVEPPADEIRAPIDVAGERWGWMTVPGLTRADSRRLFLYIEEMLPRFAALVGVGVANKRAKETLIALAQTDPLTGLANHRVFHERLEDEMSRAQRYGRPVAVAMIDIDNFKAINDSVGHLGGDKVLAAVAQRVAGVMRSDAVVARLGGDEIGVILPESAAHGATVALQRARLAVSAKPLPPAGIVTLSAGICDSTHADTPERILELADDALYWSKLHGRNTAMAYSPDVVKPMSEDERAHRLTRTRALVGLKALARMIDARSPGNEDHSERVARLAGRLAQAAGWPAEMAEALGEAAAIHDVGKLTLDQQLSDRPVTLNRIQEQQWQRHPELGAQITAQVLDPEQTNWIRWHHERPDGGGFPDGLSAEQLPEGAALLALANRFDRLTHGRPGKPPLSAEQALAACMAEAGTRFTEDALAALNRALPVAAEVEDG